MKSSFWYRNGVSLALAASCMAGQAWTGWYEHNNERQERHATELTLNSYLTSGHFIQTTFENWESEFFWFESFQNWQSEFVAVISIIVLSIFLRQQGSPESKPVDASHEHTGSS